MTTGPNKILDDFAKLMTDMAGSAQGLRREMETAFQHQAEKFLAGMDLVKREEFEAVKEMAAKAREDNDLLLKRIAELEEKIGSGAAK
ncbi:accessory factor UbiK family protein [Oricola sp.]|uniref:accessory factor UbiK family protein n=1 Tax=Oricola sp. TaxID=1979950 RepID=UPI003BAC0E72